MRERWRSAIVKNCSLTTELSFVLMDGHSFLRVEHMSDKTLKELLVSFSEWNESYKKGNLDSELRASYLHVRRELCALLLMAQRLAIEPGAAQRGALRVARAYQVEFGFPSGEVAAITHDISTSGLSALVAESPPTGTSVWLRIKVGIYGVIVGRCRVVKIIPKQGSILMGVAFEGLGAEADEKIESIVCDVVVTEIRGLLRIPNKSAVNPS